MNREDFEANDKRVAARANRLWEDAGRPEGGQDPFMERARELVAMESVEPPTVDSADAARPTIEEASIQENLGEFPTLRDQGEEMTFPDPDAEPGDDPYTKDDIRLSDGDASETGGVLPVEDQPDEGLRQVSLADADVTASALDANDDPPTDDLNDDGIPDLEDLDDDATETEAIDPDDGATVPDGYDHTAKGIGRRRS